jgi:hypothetical protein
VLWSLAKRGAVFSGDCLVRSVNKFKESKRQGARQEWPGATWHQRALSHGLTMGRGCIMCMPGAASCDAVASMRASLHCPSKAVCASIHWQTDAGGGGGAWQSPAEVAAGRHSFSPAALIVRLQLPPSAAPTSTNPQPVFLPACACPQTRPRLRTHWRKLSVAQPAARPSHNQGGVMGQLTLIWYIHLWPSQQPVLGWVPGGPRVLQVAQQH